VLTYAYVLKCVRVKTESDEEYRMERLSLTSLRKQLYRVFDRVLETGVPVEVERNGRTVIIAPGQITGAKLGSLPRRNGIVGDPDELVKVKVGEWDELRNFHSST
jgi:hypothetical protein